MHKAHSCYQKPASFCRKEGDLELSCFQCQLTHPGTPALPPSPPAALHQDDAEAPAQQPPSPAELQEPRSSTDPPRGPAAAGSTFQPPKLLFFFKLVSVQYIMYIVNPMPFILQKADKEYQSFPASSQPQMHGISHISGEMLTLLCWLKL